MVLSSLFTVNWVFFNPVKLWEFYGRKYPPSDTAIYGIEPNVSLTILIIRDKIFCIHIQSYFIMFILLIKLRKYAHDIIAKSDLMFVSSFIYLLM